MAYSDAQRRATNKYRKLNTKNMTLTFYPSDMFVYEWLQTKSNKAGYIKQLIIDDIERSKQ